MSESTPSKVFMFDPTDPEMQKANEEARATFRYFWRELSWERRRIVPALDLACVKAPFSDGEDANDADDHPQVEQMWLGEVAFDGQFVSGELLNAPNWLTSVKQGDSARFRLDQITDWMYAIRGEVYGAYTVNLLRSRMNTYERKDHDNAWGLDFGDPLRIRVVPQKKSWFGKGTTEIGEHPMSLSMATKLEETISKNPSMITEKDEKGWTILHQEALAGNASSVETLLECGADPNAITNDGQTPLRLARVLGWDKVIDLLIRKGATQ